MKAWVAIPSIISTRVSGHFFHPLESAPTAVPTVTNSHSYTDCIGTLLRCFVCGSRRVIYIKSMKKVIKSLTCVDTGSVKASRKRTAANLDGATFICSGGTSVLWLYGCVRWPRLDKTSNRKGKVLKWKRSTATKADLMHLLSVSSQSAAFCIRITHF